MGDFYSVKDPLSPGRYFAGHIYNAKFEELSGGIKADARRFFGFGNYGTVDGREPGQSRTRGRSMESKCRQGCGRRTQRGFPGGCGAGRGSGVDVRLRYQGGRGRPVWPGRRRASADRGHDYRRLEHDFAIRHASLCRAREGARR